MLHSKRMDARRRETTDGRGADRCCPLKEESELYKKFRDKEDGCIKVVRKPKRIIFIEGRKIID